MAVSTRVTAEGAPISGRRNFLGWAIFLALVGIGLWWGIASGHCEQHLSGWVRLSTTGLTLGAIYAMIALGYTMVYGVLQLLNFAHSEVFMIGTFAGLYTITKLFGVTGSKYPNGVGGVFLVAVLLGAILLAGLASGITAVVMERLAYRPLRKGGASRLGYLITAIGVSLWLFLRTFRIDDVAGMERRGDGSPPPVGRIQFLSMVGLTVNALALAIIVLDGVGAPLLTACQQS